MSLSFNTYQKFTNETAVYTGHGSATIQALSYVGLGLAGESGEVCEKLKKTIRDNNGIISDEIKSSLIKELGDVLWYIARLCEELQVNMQDVVETNVAKLLARKEQNKIHGNGDNR